MAELKTIRQRITPKPSPSFFPSVNFISLSLPSDTEQWRSSFSSAAHDRTLRRSLWADCWTALLSNRESGALRGRGFSLPLGLNPRRRVGSSRGHIHAAQDGRNIQQLCDP